jgi:hypothetical protein
MWEVWRHQAAANDIWRSWIAFSLPSNFSLGMAGRTGSSRGVMTSDQDHGYGPSSR